MAELEIDGADVVRIILQFCRENGLHSSFAALQEESQVTLNCVESVETFLGDIHAGRWEPVLRVASGIALPADKLVGLYEQLVLELVEHRETDLAKQLLRTVEPLLWLQAERPERYKHLESLATKPYFDSRDAYPEGTSKEGRRAALAQQLAREVCEAPASRLLVLVGQALKWQRFQGLLPPGSKLDLFRDAVPTRVREDEAPPSRELKQVPFGKKARPEIACFSPDGQWLVTGSSDGFVEVRMPETGKLSKQLTFQAKDHLMMHEAAVLCLDLSRDGELIAAGSQDGMIKVWRLGTGQCVRRIPKSHDQGVTCVVLSRDASQVLSGSFDGTARLHGLRSGKVLLEFRGHTSYVNDVLFTPDGGRVLTGSSDGTIRVWDTKTVECLNVLHPPQQVQTTSAAVCSLTLWPPNTENVLVCNKSSTVYLMSLTGHVVKAFEVGAGFDLVHCAVSPRADWLLCAADDNHLRCVSAASGKVERQLRVCDKELIGVAHHPFRNIVATWAIDGLLRIWVP